MKGHQAAENNKCINTNSLINHWGHWWEDPLQGVKFLLFSSSFNSSRTPGQKPGLFSCSSHTQEIWWLLKPHKHRTIPSVPGSRAVVLHEIPREHILAGSTAGDPDFFPCFFYGQWSPEQQNQLGQRLPSHPRGLQGGCLHGAVTVGRERRLNMFYWA